MSPGLFSHVSLTHGVDGLLSQRLPGPRQVPGKLEMDRSEGARASGSLGSLRADWESWGSFNTTCDTKVSCTVVPI